MAAERGYPFAAQTVGELDDILAKLVNDEGCRTKVAIEKKIIEHASAVWNTKTFQEQMQTYMDDKVHEAIQLQTAHLSGQVEQLSKEYRDRGRGQIFNERRADRLNVPELDGTNGSVVFTEFADGIKNWAEALYPGAVEMMEIFEDYDKTIEEHRRNITDPNLHELSTRLYEKLMSAVKGNAISFIKKCQP